MMTAGVMVAATMRLSSTVDLIIGRVKPPEGMYIRYDGEWQQLLSKTLSATKEIEDSDEDRELGPIPPDEQKWLAHDSFQRQSEYPGGVYDMIFVAPEIPHGIVA